MSFWRRIQDEQSPRLARRLRRSKAYDRAREPTAIGAAMFGERGAQSAGPPPSAATPAASPEPATAVTTSNTVSRDGSRPEPGKRQTIELRLMHAEDLFEMPQTDLFSEYRNFLTGIDFCISELRARRSRRPVRLEIHLPPEELDDQSAERITRALRRYCKHRMRYNRRETRALRLSGISALQVGLPVSAVGFVMVGAATGITPSDGAVHLIVDHLGWVLMWLGLWFPLDEFLFYPLGYGREDRVLRLLYDAEVVIVPHDELRAEPPRTGPV